MTKPFVDSLGEIGAKVRGKLLNSFSEKSGLLISLSLGLAGTLMRLDAIAAPKGPAGQTCKSSGTTTVNGKEEGWLRNNRDDKEPIPTSGRLIMHTQPRRIDPCTTTDH